MNCHKWKMVSTRACVRACVPLWVRLHETQSVLPTFRIDDKLLKSNETHCCLSAIIILAKSEPYFMKPTNLAECCLWTKHLHEFIFLEKLIWVFALQRECLHDKFQPEWARLLHEFKYLFKIQEIESSSSPSPVETMSQTIEFELYRFVRLRRQVSRVYKLRN